MNKYKVNFEIFGKKMRTIIEANNIDEAKEKIKNKIIFHKVKLHDYTVADLRKFFNMN